MTLPRLPPCSGPPCSSSCRRWRAPYELPTGFLDRTFTDADGKEAKYVLFVPHDYKGDKPYPLILFLHGSGETGDRRQAADLRRPRPRRSQKQRRPSPSSSLFPQSQDRTWQADSKDAQRALAMLAAVQKEYKIDDKRLYLTGLSMGGFGTWSLAAKYPDTLGRHRAGLRRRRPGPGRGRSRTFPAGVFHGDADTAVPVERSRKMIDGPQGRRRQAQVRRIRRRRPQQLGKGVRHAGAVRVAAATTQVT